MSGWGCRHQVDDQCQRVGVICKPGMRGCVLIGRVVFADDVNDRPRRRKPAARAAAKTGGRRARSRT